MYLVISRSPTNSQNRKPSFVHKKGKFAGDSRAKVVRRDAMDCYNVGLQDVLRVEMACY